MRSALLHRLALGVLLPTLVLAGFGGTRFLVHAHGGEGLHLHPMLALDGDFGADADKAARHCHEHAPGGNEHAHRDTESDHHGAPAEPCQKDVVILLPDHELLRSRGIDLHAALAPTATVSLPAVVMPEAGVRRPPVGSLGMVQGGDAWRLCALNGLDRLVRTSHALLI